MSPPNPPPSTEEQRAELVGAILRLEKEWSRVLGQGRDAPRAALQYFRTRAEELSQQAQSLGLGGIAHHLATARAASDGPLDVERARASLENVRIITLQVRDEVSESARRRIDRDAAPSMPFSAPPARGALEPPPMITSHPSNAPRDAPAPSRSARPATVLASEAEATMASAKDHVLQPAPAPPPVASGPNMRVLTMFGLRAFGRQKAAPQRSAEAPSAASAPPTGMLGLKRSPREASPSAPPPLLSSPLPPLYRDDEAPARPGGFERREERVRHGWGPAPTPRELSARDSPVRRKSSGRGARMKQGPPAIGRWLAAFAAAGLVVVAGVVFLVLRRPSNEAGTSTTPSATASSGVAAAAPTGSTGLAASMPRSRLLTDDEQFRSLLSQIHGHGGKESPELRGLLDEQAAVQAKLLKAGKCEGQGACSEFEKARGLLLDAPRKAIQHRRRPADPNAAAAWTNGLRLPDGLVIEDDPLVKRYFQQYAENRVGRETLQSMLFRCGSYRDLIRATLVRYDVPEGVLALVLVESGCEPMARSPVGALGLFQFMPDSGRVYGLRIIDNVLDERLSQTKATEAGVHFLSDLYAKLGSWDLVFAAYNLGPFGLLARMHKAGDDVGFWDLVDADMLPDETAQYVPRIEALALILSNLQRLRFAGLQMRSPEDTSDLEVASGTRLSLIARAASTSLDEIRRLNRDIIADRVPNVASGRFVVQVPASVVEQARDTLADLRSGKNDEDMCVPSSFDWGRQRFTPELTEACRKRLAEVGPTDEGPPIRDTFPLQAPRETPATEAARPPPLIEQTRPAAATASPGPTQPPAAATASPGAQPATAPAKPLPPGIRENL